MIKEAPRGAFGLALVLAIGHRAGGFDAARLAAYRCGSPGRPRGPFPPSGLYLPCGASRLALGLSPALVPIAPRLPA
jgi:hypothetical protein